MVPARDDYAQALEYLRMLAQQDFATAWAGFSRGKITSAQIRDMFAAIVSEYGEQASWEAVNYLVLERSLDEDLAGLAFPQRATPAQYSQAVSSFDWAVNTSRKAGALDRALARRKLEGVLVRLVSQPAHKTVIDTTRRDGTAFARVPEPGACSFCLMLASRGATYGSRARALRVGAQRRTLRKGTKQAHGDAFHDNCRCIAIEVKRDGSNLPRINKDLEQLWSESHSRTHEDFKKALALRAEQAAMILSE